MRPRYAIPAVVVVVAAVATVIWLNDGRGNVAGGGVSVTDAEAGDEDTSGSATPGESDTTDGAVRSPERPAPREQSTEVALGEPVDAGDFVVTVIQAAVSEDSGGREQVVVNTRLENNTDQSQPYAPHAFSLVGEGGVRRAQPTERDDALGLGSLDPGETVTGSVVFDAGPGSHTLVYDPGNPDDVHRFTWTLEL